MEKNQLLLEFINLVQNDALLMRQFTQIFENINQFQTLILNEQYQILSQCLLELIINIHKMSHITSLKKKINDTNRLLRNVHSFVPTIQKVSVSTQYEQEEVMEILFRGHTNSSPVTPRECSTLPSKRFSKGKHQSPNCAKNRFIQKSIFVDSLPQREMHKNRQIQQRQYNIITNQ